jgi:EAL domain-containing protein (putative c-di-GMP-specific phosphodiesterase class I)
VTSVEALVRWYDADLGTVSPVEFIPVAEHSGQIHELGRWVRRAACAQARRWHDEGRSWAIAVNVSSVELAGADLAEEILALLDEHGLHPQSLEIEVTETSAVADLPLARRHLGLLREAGVRVHLDDFGTGYSSFAMLRQLPVSTVKIDRSIVDGIDSSVADAQLLAGVINAAHSLGLRVVAEGVERPEQLDRLRDLGCDSAQGFLICRPRRAGELGVTTPLVAESAGRVTPPHPARP